MADQPHIRKRGEADGTFDERGDQGSFEHQTLAVGADPLRPLRCGRPRGVWRRGPSGRASFRAGHDPATGRAQLVAAGLEKLSVAPESKRLDITALRHPSCRPCHALGLSSSTRPDPGTGSRPRPDRETHLAPGRRTGPKGCHPASQPRWRAPQGAELRDRQARSPAGRHRGDRRRAIGARPRAPLPPAGRDRPGPLRPHQGSRPPRR